MSPAEASQTFLKPLRSTTNLPWDCQFLNAAVAGISAVRLPLLRLPKHTNPASARGTLTGEFSICWSSVPPGTGDISSWLSVTTRILPAVGAPGSDPRP
jgi:hypothetical protein